MLRAFRAGELLRARCRGEWSMRVSLAAAQLKAGGARRPDAEALWGELDDRLRAFVGRRVRDPVVVDDLAQEILLRLYTHIDRLRDQDRLDAWAYQVARNVLADYWRERASGREVSFNEELTDRLAAAPEVEPEEDETRQLRAEIASCLAPMVQRLAPPFREAILLTDLGVRTQAEAAADLGLSVPGTKARVQRGRAQLRELLRACCRIQLDRRGQVTELEANGASCGAGALGAGPCGCTGSDE